MAEREGLSETLPGFVPTGALRATKFAPGELATRTTPGPRPPGAFGVQIGNPADLRTFGVFCFFNSLRRHRVQIVSTVGMHIRLRPVVDHTQRVAEFGDTLRSLGCRSRMGPWDYRDLA
jgi:hypothetical protein